MHRILGDNVIDEIFCCMKESKKDTNLWCRDKCTPFFFFHVLPLMAKGCHLRKDAVIWVPFVPWCLKTVCKSTEHHLDVFEIDFVTSSDKDKDELLKLKLDVMKVLVTHTKEAFRDEFRKTTVVKDKKDDDQHFEELWRRFW